MRGLMLYLMFVKGHSFGKARSMVNAYGKFSGDSQYSIGDNFRTNWENALITDATTNDVDFLEFEETLANLITDESKIKVR